MLSPLSAAFDGSSAAGGSDAITFMSGSGSAPGITISGSSPGCQRSIFSTGPPSELLPKNRLAVFTEKPSRDGGGSSDIETSYWASGGALSASASSGSSDARSADGATAAVFAPATEALDVDGSSVEGVAWAGAGVGVSGGTVTRRSPFRVRSTLGKSEA